MATALSACAAMGLRTAYLGAMGDDHNGSRIREELLRRGIDLSNCVVRKGVNQFAVIAVDEKTGERIVLWDRDDALLLTPSEVSARAVASARLVHVDDVDQEAAILAATLAREAGVPATSDIDRVTDRTDALVDAVSVPIFAEHVPPAITGEDDPERALRKLRKRHPGLLCVTLGPRGSVILDGDRMIHEPAIRGARGRHDRRRRCVPRRVHPRAAARRISPRHPPLRQCDGRRQLHATGGDRLGADAGGGQRRYGASASLSSRPIASGSVMPSRCASVGARSIGADGCRYSPFLIPRPNSNTGTCVS